MFSWRIKAEGPNQFDGYNYFPINTVSFKLYDSTIPSQLKLYDSHDSFPIKTVSFFF